MVIPNTSLIIQCINARKKHILYIGGVPNRTQSLNLYKRQEHICGSNSVHTFFLLFILMNLSKLKRGNCK